MKHGITGKLIVGFACALVLSAPSVAQRLAGGGQGFAQRRPPMERAFGAGAQGRWWNNPQTIDQLKLTDEQRRAMDDILMQHREKLIDLRANLQKAELELEPLMKGDQPNETKLTSQIDKVAQARAELEKANARFLLAIRGKLTPEQWKQLQDDRMNIRRNQGQGQGLGRGQGRGAWAPGGRGQGGGQMAPPPPGAPGQGPQGSQSPN